ncbi:MAG: UDP-N-acetylmuramate dehydrogenase [Proteobacteria bacterium]|nr:MAG: UDP-N-acetylmuramate dehydrogenase [Pseudomonadota bacterium]
MSIRPFDLTSYNSYRLRASAAVGLVPESSDELLEALRQYPEAILLGSGHNIILSRNEYESAFICVTKERAGQIRVANDTITAYAGVGMKDLSLVALEHRLSGLEVFYDIPSSLGGATVMNAGASGEQLASLIVNVIAYDRETGLVREYSVDELEYGYRTSIFQRCPQLVVIEASIRLVPGNPVFIRTKMENIKRQRWEKQPRDLPNAGSVFRRPPGYYVGAMMDELSLRGLRVGGAEVSRKHSGFIVNTGGATGADILELIELIVEKVHNHFGVRLVREQIVV